MIIAIDFDGTIVDHQFPDIGPEVPGAFMWLREFQQAGAQLMLWTMRSDGREDGTNTLADAVNFCRANGVEFWGVNENPQQKGWTGSPKQYAHLYIDDAAFGCPMRDHPSATSRRPVVDWEKVGPEVLALLAAQVARPVAAATGGAQ